MRRVMIALLVLPSILSVGNLAYTHHTTQTLFTQRQADRMALCQIYNASVVTIDLASCNHATGYGK